MVNAKRQLISGCRLTASNIRKIDMLVLQYERLYPQSLATTSTFRSLCYVMFARDVLAKGRLGWGSAGFYLGFRNFYASASRPRWQGLDVSEPAFS